MGSFLKAIEGRRVKEEIVRSVDRPDFTETWHPFTHSDVLDAAYEAIQKIGMKITEKIFSLSRDGNNMFGLLTLNETMNGKALCIGLRNSISVRKFSKR